MSVQFLDNTTAWIDQGSGRIRRLLPAPVLRRHELGAHLILDLAGDLLVLLQEVPDVVLALADALALVAVPGAGLLDDAVGAREIDDLAFAGDALPVHDLELGLAERRGHLVL